MTQPLVSGVRLVRCSACAELVKSQERVCPHCGAGFGAAGGVVGLVTAAISTLMMGCAIAVYGVPTTTDSESETDTEGTNGNSTSGVTDATAGTTMAPTSGGMTGTGTGTEGTTGTTTGTDGTTAETGTGTETDGTETDGTETDTETMGTTEMPPSTTALYGVSAT